MIEELKIIAEIFKTATDSALYAYIMYLLYELAKIAIYVFPIIGCIKYVINKLVVDEEK